MKVSLDLIVSVFSLSLLNNAVTRVDSFCSVAKSASTTTTSTESNTASFGISISPLPTTMLKSKNNDGNESENGSDDKYKNMATNDIHKGRFEKESLNNSKRFATGEELTSLREDLESLRQNLEWARALKDESRIEPLEYAIRKGETLDPSFMYTKAQKMITETNEMKDASEEEKKIVIDKWTSVATDAREFLPQLNMEGLWVGNYGDSKGLQLVNITYSGDELIARKVTGDVNVPRGEKSFTVNLQPTNSSALPPVKVISDNRSGAFSRYPGKGQVSRKGFKDNRFVEGQMILFENRFSFVWIPTKHHVSFHRPSPELTLKLLRNTISREDEVENMRDHLARCFDMDLSTAIARQQDPLTVDEPLRRITTQDELEQVEERLKQSDHKNVFFRMGKWRNYIDQVLDKKKST